VILHPGVADDTDFKRLEVYGRSEPVGVKVHEIMNTAPKSMLLALAEAKKEAIYQSSKREPLGKQYVRGHELPSAVLTNGFGKGTPQEVAGDQTKRLLHPLERIVPEEERQMYIKSHANYLPGEQRHRGYNWVDQEGMIDPAQYRFGGAVKEGEKAGVAKTFNPGLDPHWKRPDVVVEKLLEDYRELASEGLQLLHALLASAGGALRRFRSALLLCALPHLSLGGGPAAGGAPAARRLAAFAIPLDANAAWVRVATPVLDAGALTTYEDRGADGAGRNMKGRMGAGGAALARLPR
jgi:hypothetical protein